MGGSSGGVIAPPDQPDTKAITALINGRLCDPGTLVVALLASDRFFVVLCHAGRTAQGSF